MITLYAILPAHPRSLPELNPMGELHSDQAVRSADATKVGLEASTLRACITVWLAHADRRSSTNWGTVMTHHRSTRLALTALVTAAGLGLSGCSSDNGAAPAPSTLAPPPAAPSTTATSPAAIAKQKATTAYLDMWSDMADAATTSDWQSPKLAQNATGEALQTISRSLYADHYNGLVTKGRPLNHPEPASAEPLDNPTSVTLTDCGDSTNWLKYRADNGQPAEDGPSGRRQIEALVKKAVDGSWKVTTFAVREVGSCTG
ncbi:MAG TPA: hypothetical protein VGL64_08475 [Amycolatopsis sp.]|jgi:hypothetical protein